MVCILFNRALAVSWSDEISSSVRISLEGLGFWTKWFSFGHVVVGRSLGYTHESSLSSVYMWLKRALASSGALLMLLSSGPGLSLAVSDLRSTKSWVALSFGWGVLV